MQVFKVYFKVLKGYLGQWALYIGIFSIILFGFIVPNSVKEQISFSDKKCNFAVFDYDNSQVSKDIVAYMSKKHELKSIENDSIEVMQDELFNRNVDCIVKIKKDFGENFKSNQSNLEDYIEIIAIPNTYTSQLFEQDYNRFVKYAKSYAVSGIDISSAMEKAAKTANTELSTKIVEKENNINYNAVYYFFNYMSWIIVIMCVITIGRVLVIFQKKDLRSRIACSAYSFARISKETLMGVVCSGFVIIFIFFILAVFAFKTEILSMQWLLYMTNAISYMFVALAITYLVSQLIKNDSTMNMIGNTVSLGMSFLCGVFVPMEFLSDTVIKIAHFLPTYWYQLALIHIQKHGTENIGKPFSYMGIQILFALALVTVGIIVSRRNQSK